MELKKEKKIPYADAKKLKDKKVIKKRKWKVSNSSVIESSGESSVEHQQNKTFGISKCSHFMDNCKDLRAMIKKQNQKTKKSYKSYRESNKELNARSNWKEVSKIYKKQEKEEEQKKSSNFFRYYRFSIMKVEKVPPAWQKELKV